MIVGNLKTENVQDTCFILDTKAETKRQTKLIHVYYIIFFSHVYSLDCAWDYRQIVVFPALDFTASNAIKGRTSGPSCSKLTMSSVNVSLKLRLVNMAYTLIFCWKKNMWVAFAKATHIFFQQKYLWIRLDTILTRTVHILVTNELVKLTMLWTTQPIFFFFFFFFFV